tara:strand:+ start:870 stop:1502 length:633 start_codon:yes stop_codon:yes gene_type:complete
MSLRSFYLALAALTLVSFVPLAHVSAQENNAESAEQADKMSEEEIQKTKKDILNDKILEIGKGLGQKEMAHFYVIYSSYAVINMVEDVKVDVANAVQACSENNPDMESKIKKRYEEWEKALSESMDKARDNVQNMEVAQNYIPRSELKELNGLVKATRNETAIKFEKVPVSTPEACEFMLTKMDDTQTTMVTLLDKTISNFPELLKKTQE